MPVSEHDRTDSHSYKGHAASSMWRTKSNFYVFGLFACRPVSSNRRHLTDTSNLPVDGVLQPHERIFHLCVGHKHERTQLAGEQRIASQQCLPNPLHMRSTPQTQPPRILSVMGWHGLSTGLGDWQVAGVDVSTPVFRKTVGSAFHRPCIYCIRCISLFEEGWAFERCHQRLV